SDIDNVMIIGFMKYLSSPVAGIAVAGIMAAIISTASTIFIILGFSLSRDLLERYVLKDLSDKRSLILGRLTQTFVAIVACIIALIRPSAIYWISIYAGAFFAVGWFPTIFASFTWKRMNSKAALASMITGVVSFVILGELIRNGFVNLPLDLDELIIAFVLSVLVLIIVALMTKPNEHELNMATTMKTLKLNKETVDFFLSQPDGLAKIKRQYRQIQITAIAVSIVAIVILSYLLIKLA